MMKKTIPNVKCQDVEKLFSSNQVEKLTNSVEDDMLKNMQQMAVEVLVLNNSLLIVLILDVPSNFNISSKILIFVRPCYVDGNTGKVHPYCSREHAKQASAPPNVYSPTPSPNLDAAQRCVLPSCTKLRYYDNNSSRYSEYCGLSHRNQDRSRKGN